MKWRIKKDNGRYRLTRSAIIIVSILSVIGLASIAFGACYIVFAGLSSDDIPIIIREDSEDNIAEMDPDLEILEEEPGDITEDIYDLVPEDAEARPIYQQDPIEEEIINILIIGEDAHSDKTNGRSDIMMLLSYDVKNNKASLISFMRDTWVPIEGYGYNRLNATYAWGGVGLTINTINMVFDLDIQNYIVVDFEDTVELVDKLGGIEVSITDVEANYYNRHFGWGIEKGINKLDGKMTLAHARNRKSNGGDFERTRRQRDIILAVYEKIMGQRDIKTMSNFIYYAMGSIDTNIGPEKMFLLAGVMFKDHGLSIDQGRVPVDDSWDYASIDGKSVLVIDFEKNTVYLKDILYMD